MAPESLWSKIIIVVLTVLLTTLFAWLRERQWGRRLERAWVLLEKAPKGDPARPALRARAAQESARLRAAYDRENRHDDSAPYRRASLVLQVTAFVLLVIVFPDGYSAFVVGLSEGFAKDSGWVLPGIVVLAIGVLELLLAFLVLRLLAKSALVVGRYWRNHWSDWRVKVTALPVMAAIVFLAAARLTGWRH